MNKKQLVRLIHEQQPKPTHGFEARIDNQLTRLTKEEQPLKKRYRFPTILVAAILLVVVLAGTALASNMLSIFDIFNTADPISPLEGAEGLVSTNLGSSENELVVLTVEEAVFDGQGVLVKCRIAPQNMEKYAMLNVFLQGAPEEIYIGESFPVEVDIGNYKLDSENGVISVISMPGDQRLLVDGQPVEIPADRNDALEKGLPVYLNNGTLCYTELDDFRILRRRDGKETIGYWIDIAIGDDLIYADLSNVEEQEDGSVILWASGIADEVLNFDSIEVSVSARLYEGNECGNEAKVMDAISFTLPKSEEERLYNIIPADDSKGNRFEILSGSIAFTKVRGYLTVKYKYEQAETGEDMGIDFLVYDAEGNRIPTGSSNGSVEADENGVHWRSSETQSFNEVPETIWLEAKVIGADNTLGRVECKLVEASNSQE